MDITNNQLHELRLWGVAKTLPIRLQESQQEKWSYTEFLNGLLVDEIRYRDQKSSEGRLRKAKFRTVADFDHFDFTLKRSLSKTQLKELRELTFLKSHQNLLLLGPTGVGKTFVATAIGHQACVEGYSVLFEGMNCLIETIKLNRMAGTFLRLRKRLIEVDLLIIDDLGIKPLDGEMVQDLYDLLEERYLKKSTIITSQLPVANWKEVITDAVVFEAIVDRVAHGYKIEITGDSYRKRRSVDKVKGTSGN
jgi:DNA replication protein DnaC